MADAPEAAEADLRDPVALGTDQQILHTGEVQKLNPDGDPRNPESWVRRTMWLTVAGGLFYKCERQGTPIGCHIGGREVVSLPQYLEDHFAFEVRPLAGPAADGTAHGATIILATATSDEREVWLQRLTCLQGKGGKHNLNPLDIYSKGGCGNRRRSGTSMDMQAEAAMATDSMPAVEPTSVADEDGGLSGLSDEEDEPRSLQSSYAAGPQGVPRWGVRRNSQGAYAEKMHTSLVLDWDDTIFPTTWVRRDCGMNWRLSLESQLEPGPRKRLISSLLDRLVDRAVEFFSEACAHANIIIVTLARRPWVEMSLQNFLPKLKGVIDRLDLKIIYAQEYVQGSPAMKEYSQDDFKSSEEVMYFWTRIKSEAIMRELDELHWRHNASWKNILSLGDSDFERFGTMAASEDYMKREMEGGRVLHTGTSPNGYTHTAEGVSKDGHLKRLRTKTVKMLTEPTVEELTAELALLKRWLPHMVKKDGGFDIELDSTDDNERLQALHKQVTGEDDELSWEELAGMKA